MLEYTGVIEPAINALHLHAVLTDGLVAKLCKYSIFELYTVVCY